MLSISVTSIRAAAIIPIVPILVVPHGVPRPTDWPCVWHALVDVFDASAATLGTPSAGDRGPRAGPTDPHRRIRRGKAAAYRPTPTIIEAAQMLYRRHGVADIADFRADVPNLRDTTAAILRAITEARRERRHLVLFVTGIPGAGKTLCGLNAVFGDQTGAAFLTGNLPLVHVMREALAQDARDHGRSIVQARQETEAAIQPVNGFLNDNRDRPLPPHEHVIVFDEAQRAWDAELRSAQVRSCCERSSTVSRHHAPASGLGGCRRAGRRGPGNQYGRDWSCRVGACALAKARMGHRRPAGCVDCGRSAPASVRRPAGDAHP